MSNFFNNRPSMPSLDPGFVNLNRGSRYGNNPVQFARYKLSEGNDANEPLLVPNGSGNAISVHKCDAAAVDEVYLWCSNHTAVEAELTLGIGGVSAYQQIIINIPANSGLIQVYPGIPHQNTEIKVFSDTSAALSVLGFVNRKYLNVIGEEAYGYDGTE